ncbi:MFS transporter [Pseudalkalibacillus caeni]|uniref:Multidrug efflux MFS transporter n=1 Tax=Exobacillus caeni TaxID=2574798 RepID=A0A5R9FEG6_9BACL|nr:MFS transporter [Pseudalkalibacillus caeni]TLS38954.1 multidrug efflux MFS transporter [Pseudalkalibacillus caeni]
MWFANFFVAASATMVMPFLPLYIETFGNYSDAYVQKWAGFIFGVTFLVAFFVSPLWGRFGDRYGRKKILVTTSAGIATSIFLMGYVHSVEQLFLLRLFMGFVTGFIPTSLAFISAQTPKKIAGKTLGTLQTGTVSGSLLGPIIGGALADSVGFTYTFILTSSVILFASVLVLFGTKEVVVEKNHKQQPEENYSMKQVLRHVFSKPVLVTVMSIAMLIQIANFSIQPILSLYVTQLNRAENIAFLAGIVFSITGLGNLLATRKWGKLGDRIGHEKILLVLLILAAVFFIPQGFVTNLWQLVILRFLFGIQLGGLIPCMTAYIRQAVPLSIQGEVLGYNVSLRFLGNVIGPVLGGILSGIAGISSVFFITGTLFIIGAGLLFTALKAAPKLKETADY